MSAGVAGERRSWVPEAEWVAGRKLRSHLMAPWDCDGDEARDVDAIGVESLAELLRVVIVAMSCCALPPERIAGVYFLVRGGEIVYVGRSVNVLGRIASHAGRFEFDSVAVLRMDETIALVHVEDFFIRLLSPVENDSRHHREANGRVITGGILEKLIESIADPARALQI